MKINRIIAALLALMLLVTGCTKGNETITTEDQNVTTTTTSAETTQSQEGTNTIKTNYPITIRNYTSDRKYLEQEFKAPPERVIVKNRATLEILLELGLEDKIVLAPKSTSIMPKYQAQYDKLNTIDDIYTAKEQMLASEPDLVIGWYSGFMKEDRGTTEFWNEKGVNTFIQRNTGAELTRQMDNVYWDIIDLGKIFDCQEKAYELVQSMQAEVHDLAFKIEEHNKAKFETYDQMPGVAVIEVADGEYRLYGQKALAHDMLVSLRLKDVTNGYGYGYTDEHLIQRDPDVLLVVYFSSQSEEEVVNKIYNNPALGKLKAVVNKRVYGIELDNMYGGGMQTVEGYYTMAKSVYPDLFK